MAHTSQAQLSLDLRSAAGHYDLICATQRSDFIAWTPNATGDTTKCWHTLNIEIARDQLSRWTNEPDVYITPNEFRGWRLIKLGDALNALYVDIDAHDEANPDLARLASLAIGRCETARIPSPNFVVYTGRGVHLYWLLERTPFTALPRWQACQRALVSVLDADRMSCDSTRVLRVIGTINSKTGSQVRAEMLTPQRYDFDWLSDQILPLSRAEIRDLRAERARRGERPRARATGSIYDRWHLVYRDLQLIAEHHWPCGVAEGQRDAMIHLMATALSWFTTADALDAEILHTARQWMPTLSPAEVRSYTSSVVARARHDSQRDDVSSWEWGKGRYRYKRSTLVELLGDLVTPELIPQLRAIVPDSVIRERKTNRERTRKRVSGEVAVSRADYLQAASSRREKVSHLHSGGLPPRTIADQLGVSIRTIYNDIRALQGPCP